MTKKHITKKVFVYLLSATQLSKCEITLRQWWQAGRKHSTKSTLARQTPRRFGRCSKRRIYVTFSRISFHRAGFTYHSPYRVTGALSFGNLWPLNRRRRAIFDVHRRTDGVDVAAPQHRGGTNGLPLPCLPTPRFWTDLGVIEDFVFQKQFFCKL